MELLEPSEVNAHTGYRYYSLAQVPVALAIRRYRDLDMPIDDVRAVLAAPDPATRDALISAHLARLQDQLSQTQAAVAALQALLVEPGVAASIEHRSFLGATTLAITDVVDQSALGDWWATGFVDLRAAASRRRPGR